jgi:hypothetical protein
LTLNPRISFPTSSTNQRITTLHDPPVKPKPNKISPASPNSSQGDSVISAVTRAEFETLSQGISQMVKDEVQSTISTGTDQTMLTIFRDEMAANRIETQIQIELLQQQFSTLQNLITSLMPHLANSTVTNTPPDEHKIQVYSQFRIPHISNIPNIPSHSRRATITTIYQSNFKGYVSLCEFEEEQEQKEEEELTQYSRHKNHANNNICIVI